MVQSSVLPAALCDGYFVQGWPHLLRLLPFRHLRAGRRNPPFLLSTMPNIGRLARPGWLHVLRKTANILCLARWEQNSTFLLSTTPNDGRVVHPGRPHSIALCSRVTQRTHNNKCIYRYQVKASSIFAFGQYEEERLCRRFPYRGRATAQKNPFRTMKSWMVDFSEPSLDRLDHFVRSLCVSPTHRDRPSLSSLRSPFLFAQLHYVWMHSCGWRSC